MITAIHAMNAVLNTWVMTQLAQARVFWLDWLLGLPSPPIFSARAIYAHGYRLSALPRRYAGVLASALR